MSPHHFAFGTPASESPLSGPGHTSGLLPPLLWPGFDSRGRAAVADLNLWQKGTGVAGFV